VFQPKSILKKEILKTLDSDIELDMINKMVIRLSKFSKKIRAPCGIFKSFLVNYSDPLMKISLPRDWLLNLIKENQNLRCFKRLNWIPEICEDLPIYVTLQENHHLSLSTDYTFEIKVFIFNHCLVLTISQNGMVPWPL
jgi:hypothetical protein